MYKKYIEQLEEAGKIRNLKDRSIHCYKKLRFLFPELYQQMPERTYLPGRQGFPACQKKTADSNRQL